MASRTDRLRKLVDVQEQLKALHEMRRATALAEASATLEGLTTPVDGGRALQTSLLSVLQTDDGRVLAGSVPVDTLVEYAAGSDR